MATERMLVWQGTSQLDGVTPILVLATDVPVPPKRGGRAVPKSANVKTGGMIQITIVRADMEPTVALTSGADEAICGTCPHRGKASGGTGACYVNVGHGPLSSYRSHMRRGSAPFDVERFRGHRVRFGTYGDPAAVPFEVWESIAEVADGVTGYTHQWRTADPRFARYCMASVDSMEEGPIARRMGYRNFIVRPAGSPKPRGAVTCPASAEAGKRTVCADCMQCGGTSNGRRSDITIVAHGSSARMFRPLELSVV